MIDNGAVDAQLIRSDERIRWRTAWLDSYQSFQVGGNYDLAANAFGLLLVHNDDAVSAGEGFGRHHHADAEIVTWVLEGTLVHVDDAGHEGRLTPGVVQYMSAGSGISHSEFNGASYTSRERLRLIQMWLPPETTGLEPLYLERSVTEALAQADGALVTVLSGLDRYPDAAPFRNSAAAFHVARLAPGQSVELPDAPYVHLFVAGGSAEVDAIGSVAAGDVVRARSTAVRVTATTDTEILVWEMHDKA